MRGVGRITTEVAADEVPPSTLPTRPPPSFAPDDGTSGFGDLPPSRQPGGGEQDDGDEGDEDAGDRAERGGGADPAPPPTPDVDPVDCPDGVDEVICAAAEFVQRTRGRPFRTFPEVEVLDDARFDAELLDDFDDYRADLDASDVTLTALGLIDADVSLADVFRESLEVGVVGFYDPDTGQLVVRGNDLGLYSQLVLVHELVHAFDDQWFDLSREFDDPDTDYGFAAVIEGNARRVENLWRAELSAADRQTLTAEEIGTLSQDDINRLLRLPQTVVELQLSPYSDGEVYVGALVATGGEAAVDAALTTPPSTSEEILDPTLDRSVDVEIVVEPPPADGEIVDRGRLGQLVVDLWLGPAAADGWGGDAYVSWRADGRDCTRVDLIGDDQGETAEMRSAAEAWAAGSLQPRAVEAVTIDGRDAIRATACG